jgi:hypothetical protein
MKKEKEKGIGKEFNILRSLNKLSRFEFRYLSSYLALRFVSFLCSDCFDKCVLRP